MNNRTITPIFGRNPATRARIGFGALLTAAGLLLSSPPAQAVNFAGNGDGGFGGAIGNGTLGLADDGTNINGTLTVSGTMNDVLVIYIDTGTGGFADTSGFNDRGDGLRVAISGVSGQGRSTMTFASGFTPKYAIALGPSASSFGGLWQLANGDNNSLIFISSVNLSPLNNTGPYTFSFAASQIGLVPGVRATIKIFGTYISNSGYRSTEAIAGNDTGSQGWLPFTQTAFASYTFDAGAPVTYPVTFSVDMSVPIATGTFAPGNGDTVYAAGSFQSAPWSGFELTPSAGNTNIYTGTAQDADPLGTPEQYKFKYHSVALGVDSWETIDNRPFVLQSGGQNLPLVYYDDVAPEPGTNLLTFQIDMTPQIQLGHFDPTFETVEVRGTFQTPSTWFSGFTLTNNPEASNTNLYSGTYPDGNYPGTWEQYKFVIISTGATYESIPNRTFATPGGPYTFPIAYFNNISSAYSIPVTFQVDVTTLILAGTFSPANGDTAGVQGTFQTNQWTGGFILTNNPSASNTNIYSGTYIAGDPPGTVEQYKFVVNTGGGTTYEQPASSGGNNRFFVLGGSAQTLPLVYWSDLNVHDVLSADTMITFTVDMNNAVDRFGNPFNPQTDIVLISGDFVTPTWPVSWINEQPNLVYPEFVLSNSPVGSGLYISSPFSVPAGHSLQVLYKYGIYHDTSFANTNADNEAGPYLNHSRYIRASGTYAMPTDIFGIQNTNLAAATEISFGNLVAGEPAGGGIPITWLGRPGVHLQTTTNLGAGPWEDHPETDGLSSTNWPATSASRFFRLIKP